MGGAGWAGTNVEVGWGGRGVDDPCNCLEILNPDGIHLRQKNTTRIDHEKTFPAKYSAMTKQATCVSNIV